MIRYTPTLSFELDTSIEHGVRLTQLIDSVTKAGAVHTSAVATAAVQPGAAQAAPDEDGHVIDAGDYVARDKTD